MGRWETDRERESGGRQQGIRTPPGVSSYPLMLVPRRRGCVKIHYALLAFSACGTSHDEPSVRLCCSLPGGNRERLRGPDSGSALPWAVRITNSDISGRFFQFFLRVSRYAMFMKWERERLTPAARTTFAALRQASGLFRRNASYLTSPWCVLDLIIHHPPSAVQRLLTRSDR